MVTYDHVNSIVFLQVAHYIEEEFLEYQTKKIRELSGWTNDVKTLLSGKKDPALSLFLFDEYLQKA